MSSQVSVTIYGCRGSIPVTGPEFNRYGGNTSCVVVRAGEREIVLDAGSGVINYGRDALARSRESGNPIRTTILLSHLHFDHILGLPYFSPIFDPTSTIHLFGPRSSRFDTMEEAFQNFIQSPYYPVALHDMYADKYFEEIGQADVLFFVAGESAPRKVRAYHPDHRHLIPDEDQIEAEVRCLRGYNHPKSGINIYKIKAAGRTIVYATDTEGYVHGDQRLAEFSRGADLLIHDAMYTDAHYTSLPVPTQGFGHSTVRIATELASLAEVKRLCLFHHDPRSTDTWLDSVSEEAQTIFANTTVAQDGMVFDL